MVDLKVDGIKVLDSDQIMTVLFINDFADVYELTDAEKGKLTKFNTDQLKAIFSGLLCGIDSIDFFSESKYNFTPNQMNQIIDGVEKGIDYTIYANPEYDDLQMMLIKDGLCNSLDISAYASLDYSWEQMYHIKEGLKLGLDVYAYNDPNLSVIEMISIKDKLIGEAS